MGSRHRSEGTSPGIDGAPGSRNPGPTARAARLEIPGTETWIHQPHPRVHSGPWSLDIENWFEQSDMWHKPVKRLRFEPALPVDRSAR